MTSPLDRYEVTDHEGEKVVVVNPEEMVDLLAIVEAAEKCMEWWLSDADNRGEFTELSAALETWGDWL